MLTATFTVDPDLDTTLNQIQSRLHTAASLAMHDVMRMAQDWARAEHSLSAGWRNETTNLEHTITGYVAGDPEGWIYPYEAVVPPAPFYRGQYPGGRRVTSQAYLDAHYRTDHDVSPPVDPVPDAVIGVLHHYMQYSNRLPAATGRPDIAVVTLEVHQRAIETALETLMARYLDDLD